MPNEIVYHGEPTQDVGKTVVARAYSQAGAQVGSDITMTEQNSLAIFTGDMPTAGAGIYTVRIFEGNLVVGYGDIVWDGSAETTINNLIADIAALNDISTTDVWSAATRSLTDKTGFALTTAEHTNIATAVEQAILNEGDGQQVLNAIVGAIGNTNVDEVALVAAIRTDLERVGGAIDNIPTNPLLTNDARLDNLDAAISTRSTPAELTALQSAIQSDIAALNDPTAAAIVAQLLATIVVSAGNNSVEQILADLWTTLEQDGVTLTPAQQDSVSSRVRDYILSTVSQSATPVGGIRSHTP